MLLDNMITEDSPFEVPKSILKGLDFECAQGLNVKDSGPIEI